MDLNRDVMNDLMVVYLSGEASAATRTLVEGYAREHPDYAALLRSSESVAAGTAVEPPKEVEMKSLRMTRQHILLRSLFLGTSIAFTLMPFTFVFRGREITFLLYRDVPGLGVAFWSLAAASWVACYVMHREVRKAGL